jgi:hypothetical protein
VPAPFLPRSKMVMVRLQPPLFYWPKRIGFAVAVFALLAAVLISQKPLIMDEVLFLSPARQPTLHEVVRRTREHTGAVPLGFLIENLWLRFTGYSVWLARLPSALFGVASILAVGALARKLPAESPSAVSQWLASVLFAAFPLTLRYALEARPYMLALLLSLVLTLLFLELAERPTFVVASAYALAAVLTVYTQPFAAFVCGAHFLWAAIYRKRRAAAYVGAASAIAAAALVPWYLSARSAWAHEIAEQSFRFVFTVKTPLMLVRELTGAGYWGFGIVLALCALGAARGRLDRKALVLLLLLIAVPLLGGLFADALFGYFLATRQFLWVLPAVAILGASAWEARLRETAAIALLAVILCGYKSVRYFTQPEPDWDAAATAIAGEVDRGACFRVTPEIARGLYAYFAPQLDKTPAVCPSVVAAALPSTSEHDRDALIEDLVHGGYAELRTANVGGTFVAVLRRPN